MSRILLLALPLLLTLPVAAQSVPADAVNYGVGSAMVNSATKTLIPVPAPTSSYSGVRVRGHYFTCPAAFAVMGLEVIDNTNKGYQTVALYRIEEAPPAYSQTVTVTPVFFKRWVKSGATIPVLPPVVFNKGDVYVVLGGCSANSSTTLTTPYGPAKPTAKIGTHTVTLFRCGMQHSIAANSGTGANGVGPLWSENSGSIGTIKADILLYKESFPRLDTSALPVLGTTAKLDLAGHLTGATFGLIVLGRGRVVTPTPMGTVLIGFPWVANLPVVGGTGSATLPVPKDPVLMGAKVNLQGFVSALPANFGATNGVEWVLGV